MPKTVKSSFFTILNLTLFTCLAAIVSFAQSAPELKAELKNSFERFDLHRLKPAEMLDSVRAGNKLTLNVGGQTTEIRLVPNNLLAPGYRAEATIAGGERRMLSAPQFQTFKGKIADDAVSSVRLTISTEKIEGIIERGAERFFIESARTFSSKAAANDFVVYKSTDLKNEHPATCTLHLEDKVRGGGERYAPQAAAAATAPTVVRVAEIATDADFEFVTAMGGAAAANAEILSILNMVEGAYETQLKIGFKVTYQHAWSTPDPFTATDIESALRSFQAHWNANFPTSQYPRDLAHLFTGKSALLLQGRAFIGVVCSNPDFAYGVTGKVDFAPTKFVLVAHEIGHNFNAGHVEAAQSCGDTVMNAQLTQFTPLNFCPASQGEVNTFVQANASCLTTRSLVKTKFDFDGDSRSDLTVFRPATGDWFILNSGQNNFRGVRFGQTGDVPVAEDFDGDGKTDIAVYRGGNWYLLLSETGAFRAVNFGNATDVPAPADFNGDGRSEVAVFRPSNGSWYSLELTNNNFSGTQFGVTGDVPVPADFDGDGKADISVFRPSIGSWFRLNSSNGEFFASQFGIATDRPVPADFDGDGKADIGVFRAGNWFYLKSAGGGFGSTFFGSVGDVPVPADYDGDGKADVGVFRPANGMWYMLNSGSNNAFAATQFGAAGDVPAQGK